MLGTHSCKVARGGICAVRLYEVCGIASVDFDPTMRSFGTPQLLEGYEPWEVVFAEGGASYTEEATPGGGVVHRLEISQRGLNQDVVATLRRLSVEGVVALVECQSGERLLVGYSREAAADYPLRMEGAKLQSGSQSGEGATTRFLLCSLDGWGARPCKGE